MPRTRFTAREACALLRIDAKTFRKWRAPYGEGDRLQTDGRVKMYDLKTLRAIALDHHRTLADPNDRSTFAAATTHAALQREVDDLKAEVAALREGRLRALRPVAPYVPTRAVAPYVPDESDAPDASEMLVDGTPPLRKPAVPLPNGLIGWRAMADAHGISPSTVQKARDGNRLPIVKGRWKVGRAIVEGALDARGQELFFAYWHALPSFRNCAFCPHYAPPTGQPDFSTPLLSSGQIVEASPDATPP